MEKRHFNRKRCLATAVAAVGLSAFAYNADATLSLELTASGGSPDGLVNTVSITNLNPITLDVWATVTGTGSGRQGLQIAGMSFTSTPSVGGTNVLGDFSSPGINPQSPWNANGSQSGTQYGTAGDLDLGSTNPSVAAGHWIALSSGVQGNASPNTTYSTKLGSIVFDPSAGTAGQTANLNLVPRATTSGALWFEDATVTDPGGGDPLIWSNDKNQSTGTINPFGLIVSFAGVVGTPNLWATTGTGSMATAANWDNNTVPGANQTLTFAASSVTSPVPVTVDSGRTVSGLIFNNASKSFNLGGANTLTINAGSTLNVIASPAGGHTISSPVSFGGGFTKSGAGTLTFTSQVQATAVSITGGRLKIDGATANASKVTSVTVSGGGALDLNNGGLIITGQSNAVVTAAVVAGAGGTGPGGQTWDQSGINSSYAAVDPVFRAVGILDNDNFIGGPTSPYEGTSVPAGSIIVRSTLAGDINLDATVDDTDSTVFGLFYDNGATTGHVWMEGDFNYDGLIDDADSTVLGLNFGQTAPGPIVGGVAAVPEPASFGVILMAAGAAAMRRRRAR